MMGLFSGILRIMNLNSFNSIFIMDRLDTNNILFRELKSTPPKWWIELKSDKDIYMEIRKDNSIDVYYNGGNIITGLKHNGNSYQGKIHYKYLLPEGSEYIDYDFQGGLSRKKSNINLLPLHSFDHNTLKRIKANISKYYPASSEKGIQARFIIHKNSCFIDSEFAYKVNNDIRIDLIWIDLKNKKILPVELKTIGDNRLFNDEIFKQLNKYHHFLLNFKDDFVKYCNKVFELKKSLDILPINLKSLKSLSNFSLENKPLLLLGNCENNWIKDNADKINNRIKLVAKGAYFFGKPGYDCNLISKTARNRYIF